MSNKNSKALLKNKWTFIALFVGIVIVAALSAPYVTNVANKLSKIIASEQYSGFFTSKGEVAYLKAKMDAGDSNLRAKVDSMVSFAGAPTYWPYGTISGALTAPSSGTCASPQDSSGPDYLKYNYGARLVYAKVLAYQFTGNQEYAKFARDRIIELTGTTTFGGEIYNGANQCVLELAFSLPLWIQSADLLEGSSAWSAADRAQFQNWLAGDVYTKVAWASRRRANNWGAAGSNASAMIADYTKDINPTLKEVSPVAKTLNAQTAFNEHIQQQKDRMTGVFQGDSSCPIWGIQTHGGIPDELRRGAAGCTADSIQTGDNSLVYQITHTDFLILTAEFLWHRGDSSLYDLMASSGQGSLKNAINFVINNPKNAPGITWESYRTNHLFVANRYYHDAKMREVANTTPNDAKGTFIAFAHITHYDENSKPVVITVSTPTPTPVPTVSPTSLPSPIAPVLPTATPIPTPYVDKTLPVVHILSPRDRSKITTNMVEISVKTTDNVQVARVELYIDKVLKETKTEPITTFNWDTSNIKNGKHSILVVAWDTSNNRGTKTINVTK
jgi:hypothetical protein